MDEFLDRYAERDYNQHLEKSPTDFADGIKREIGAAIDEVVKDFPSAGKVVSLSVHIYSPTYPRMTIQVGARIRQERE